LRRAGNRKPAVIYLREGRHQLNETLVLGLADGAPGGPRNVELDGPGAGADPGPAYLTFAAYRGERAVVSGGVPVTGWQKLEPAPPALPATAVGKVWVAPIPEGLERFSTLFDTHGRLPRARSDGFVPVKRGDKHTLYFPPGRLKNWDNLEDIEIHVRPSYPWVTNMLPLASVDEAAGVAKTAVSASYQIGPLPSWVHNPSGASVWVENVVEALDEPGEWVVNTRARKIYLWPRDPGPDGSPRNILAPGVTELIRIEGDIDYEGPADTPASGIAFSGLTFTHADRRPWRTEEDRLGWGLQHDWEMFDRPTAMVRLRGAEHCRITGCRFVDSGGTGVRLDLHAQRNRIEDCEFAHLGGAGILVAGYGPGTKDANHHNSVLNNHIHGIGEISWHAAGIWAWQSGHNYIAHNYVHHCPYSAILITGRITPDRAPAAEGGRTVRRQEIPPEDRTNVRQTYENWKIRERYNHSRRNVVEYNEITHSVQKLSDGNAIYVSGAGTGNIIRYNYLHENVSRSLPAVIRCDDDQHETLIYGNIVYRNYGFSAQIISKGINHIINNFIVAPMTAPRSGYISFRCNRVTDSKVRHNILIAHPSGGNAYGERPRLGSEGGDPKVTDTQMDANLYYHPTDPSWMDEHFEKMRAIGKERSSLFADPLFVDPESEDFTFQDGSPAPALGIEPLGVSRMGMRKKSPSGEP